VINNKKRIILKGAGGADAPNQTHFHFNLSGDAGTCINISNAYYIGIEDIYFIQDELSSDEHENNFGEYKTNTITISGRSCWVRGVESAHTRRFHIEIYGKYGRNNTISGCYFHDAEWYGDRGGRSYGICLSGNSEHNLIENNIFKHLRHSMVLQAGAKYNVIGYNYSKEPYGYNYKKILGKWKRTRWDVADLLFHGRKLGDITFEGPQYNLIEGNYVDKIKFDDVHESNGPYNTLFRNIAVDEENHKPYFDAFSLATVSFSDQGYQYCQNIVGCNARPSKTDFNRIDFHGFEIYWCIFSGNYYIPEWQLLSSDQCSYYKTEKPAFWYDWINWPYYPGGENPAKSRCWMADNGYDVTKVIYAGWDLYENMCGPCIFDQGKDITETPALQHNFTATEYITASYAIPDAEPVTFAAGQYIELNPGFETYENGTFEAYIDPTISCDFCNKMLLGDYYPGAQDHSAKESLKQEPEKEKLENKNNTIFESFPNPFTNSTQVIFSIKETTNVRLYITSIYGIEVLELINNELAKGIHNINIKGSALSSGIYYCILETKDSRRHIKLVKM